MKDNNESRCKNIAAFHALVRGRVQGVGFRYSAVREANRLKINGWVKNCRDGNVEVWAEASRELLDLYFDWLQTGPEYSNVESVRRENMEPRGYTDFNVEH